LPGPFGRVLQAGARKELAELVSKSALAQTEVQDTTSLRPGGPGKLLNALTIAKHALRSSCGVLKKPEVGNKAQLIERTAVGFGIAAIDLRSQKETDDRNGIRELPWLVAAP